MIATGLVALALATMQYRQASKVLHERYTNHGNSTLDKQERELYVRPSVRSECVGAPSNESPAIMPLPTSLQEKFIRTLRAEEKACNGCRF